MAVEVTSIEEYNALKTGVASRFAEVVKRLDDQRDDRLDMREEINALHTQLQEMKQWITSRDETVSGHASKLGTVDHRLASLESFDQTTEKAIRGHEATLDALSIQLARIERAADEGIDALARRFENQDTLHKDIEAALSVRIGELERRAKAQDGLSNTQHGLIQDLQRAFLRLVSDPRATFTAEDIGITGGDISVKAQPDDLLSTIPMHQRDLYAAAGGERHIQTKEQAAALQQKQAHNAAAVQTWYAHRATIIEALNWMRSSDPHGVQAMQAHARAVKLFVQTNPME